MTTVFLLYSCRADGSDPTPHAVYRCQDVAVYDGGQEQAHDPARQFGLMEVPLFEDGLRYCADGAAAPPAAGEEEA